MNMSTLMPKEARSSASGSSWTRTGKVLGRLATSVATCCGASTSRTFTPHLDVGDHVVVINAEKIHLTGRKRTDKMYRWHSGYIGGLREVPAERMIKTPPGARDRVGGPGHAAQGSARAGRWPRSSRSTRGRSTRTPLRSPSRLPCSGPRQGGAVDGNRARSRSTEPDGARRPWPACGSGPAAGRITINRRTFEDYFPRETLRMIIAQPFELTSTLGPVRRDHERGRRRADRPGRRRAPRHRPRPARVRRKAAPDAQAGRAPHPRSADAGAQEVRSAGRAVQVPVLQALSPWRRRPSYASRSPGPAGTWAPSCCACCCVHPRVTLTGVTSERLAGERLDSRLSAPPRAHRAGVSAISTPSGWPGTPTSSSSRCRTWSRSARCPCCAPRGRKVIDLSADYRLRDPSLLRDVVQGAAHRRGRARPRRCTGCPSCIGRPIAGASLVASPGCYPMGAILATGAAAQERAGAASTASSSTASPGVTGAGAQGRKVDPMYLFTEANENVQAYGIGDASPHARDRAGAVGAGRPAGGGRASPRTWCPLNRGLFTTASVPLASAPSTAELVRSTRSSTRASRSCACSTRVSVRPPDPSWARTSATSPWWPTRAPSRAVCVSALDNLGKGGSANGIQNLNIMMGWDERTGLDAPRCTRSRDGRRSSGSTAASPPCPAFLAAGVAGWHQARRQEGHGARSTRSTPTRSAAVFTSNQVKGAPVLGLDGARARRRGAGHRGLQRVLQRVHGRAGGQGRPRDGQDRGATCSASRRVTC